MISFKPNSHLCKLIARFSSFSLFSVLSISFSCFSIVPFVITIMSSKNTFVESSPSSVVSIIFWKVAGRSVRP